MKKYICVITVVVLVFSTLIFTGCDDNKGKTSATKATESQTEQTTEKKTDNNSDIQNYLDSFLEGDNDFYGAWKIKGFSYMNILFRNDKLAELVTGTEGYFSKFTVNQKAKTVTVQLMPNVIDGAYSYKFSDNKQKLTLTLDNNTIELVKQKDFSMLPKAPKNPKVDSNILGWWENADGMFYCFQDDGVMYENSISMETCYTYKAENGKIKAVYTSGSKMTDEFTYSYKNGKLILNGEKCERKKV